MTGFDAESASRIRRATAMPAGVKARLEDELLRRVAAGDSPAFDGPPPIPRPRFRPWIVAGLIACTGALASTAATRWREAPEGLALAQPQLPTPTVRDATSRELAARPGEPASLPTSELSRPTAPEPSARGPAPVVHEPATPRHAAPRPARSSAPMRTAVATVEPARSAVAEPESDALAAEVRLLSAAQVAQREGGWARALAALDEHAARFPEGDLAEARDAARVAVLCRLDRIDDARELADRFMRRYPTSVHRQKLSSTCATP